MSWYMTLAEYLDRKDVNNMIWCRVIICCFVFTTTLTAQKKAEISFQVTFQNELLELDTRYHIASNNDTIQIETLRFYVSQIELLRKGKVIQEFSQKHFLIDLDKPLSWHISEENQTDSQADAIRFNLGVDSITQVSGAFGGDLDPSNGMYWTWQSGYINFKMEGSSKFSPSRKHRFQFHLGGYNEQNNAMQSITLAVSTSNPIAVQLNLDVFLQQNKFSESHTIMSPGDKAVELSEFIASLFSIEE